MKLLWKTVRKREAGRRKRKMQQMRKKTGSGSNAMGCIATVSMTVLALFVHLALGYMVMSTVETAQILTMERSGRMVVYDSSLLERMARTEQNIREMGGDALHPQQADSKSLADLRIKLENDAVSLANDAAFSRKFVVGGTQKQQKERVLAHFHQYGCKGLVADKQLSDASFARPDTLPPVMIPFIGFMLMWWLIMIVCQGEALDLDFQRRRHPMWEWLFSHPVRPLAAFAAEMLGPMVANPIYLASPAFWMVLLCMAHGIAAGLIGGLLVGIPFAVAASCLNKAMEISIMLRLSSRSRGAVLGLISWVGYALMMLPLFTMQLRSLEVLLLKGLSLMSAWLPLWPVRALVFGWGRDPVLWQVLVSAWWVAGIMILGSWVLAHWGVNQGLQSSGADVPSTPRILSASAPRRLAGNPLYRKELLWFWRDKGAVVQAVLIPLTIGAMQAFNLRNVAEMATTHWNGLCGLGILCGTYFLLVLGPRSLSSEGGALWIALTWPHGLENLLKTKARLWWMLANLVVATIFIVTVVMYPADWWRIALVWAGWFWFSHSLAEKAVTLVTAPSSSGEPERAPQGRSFAAMLGTLAFGAGVLTQTWHVAVLGMVYSSLTAAAMWQNLRARLPFLFDPWSERLPPAPSLMHAMIGIAVMVECVGLASGIAAGYGGADSLWLVRSLAYGVIGAAAWLIMHRFLKGRGVMAADIWNWQGRMGAGAAMAAGAAVLAGIMLGACAQGYLALLRWLPATQAFMTETARYAMDHKGQFGWQVLLTVGFAPVAEEYFFRGLLFRALDREWGGWRAMAGSAAFFAIYHPPVSWLPVFMLGLCSAWLFKRGGRLLPCVLLHMTYNAVVMFFG